MSGGAMSRRKGHDAEREVAAALNRLGVPAITSRNAVGGGQRGVDVIAHDLPVSVEVKNGSRDELGRWLDQARDQADETAPGAVVHKRRGHAHAEEWFVTMRLDEFVLVTRDRGGTA